MIGSQLAVLGIEGGQLWWFAIRISGLMMIATLLAAIISGFLTSSRFFGVKPSLPWMTDLHKYFSSLTWILLTIHIVGSLLDDFAKYSPAEVFVPFVAKGNLGGIGLAAGIIAFYNFAIVDVSSRFKKKLPKKMWRGLHLTSLIAIALAIYHGFATGADTSNRLFIVLLAVGLAAATLTALVRVKRKLSET